MLLNKKNPGHDSISAETMKADIETSTQMLYELFGRIWEEEEVSLEWKEVHILRLMVPKNDNLSVCDNCNATVSSREGFKWNMLDRLKIQETKSFLKNKLDIDNTNRVQTKQ